MTPQKEQITVPGRLTPELAARIDLDQLYLAGIRYASRCLQRRPRHVRRELVHDGWVLLSTTKQWDPTKLSLEKWFILILRNLIHDLWETEGREGDLETRAQYRNYEHDERLVEGMTPDEVLVEREERAERVLLSPVVLAQVEGIEAAVAHNPVALAVLQEWKANGCDLKQRQLAERLGYSVHQVKNAREVIQYHATKIRDALTKEGVKS